MPDTITINVTKVNRVITVNVTKTVNEVELNIYRSHQGANLIISDTEPDGVEGLVWIGPENP